MIGTPPGVLESLNDEIDRELYRLAIVLAGIMGFLLGAFMEWAL